MKHKKVVFSTILFVLSSLAVSVMVGCNNSRNRTSNNSEVKLSNDSISLVEYISELTEYISNENAVGTVEDYFYSVGTTEFTNSTDKDNNIEMYYRFSGFNNLGVGKLSFETFFHDDKLPRAIVTDNEEVINLIGNEIVSTERSLNNVFSGKSYSRERTTLLKLPDLGKTATWTTEEGTVTHTATLVNLQIEIESEEITVIAIKEVRSYSFRESGVQHISYWVKGAGLLLSGNEGSSMIQYNASIGLSSLSYRELPIDIRESKSKVADTTITPNEKIIIKENGDDVFLFGQKIPLNVANYTIKKKIEYVGDEGDQALFYYLYDNEQVIFCINPAYNIYDIDILSDKYQTTKGIGVRSTINDFRDKYPDLKIYYSYVSNRYWMTTESNNFQFVLEYNSYIGKEDDLYNSDMVELKLADFKINTRITAIRIYN